MLIGVVKCVLGPVGDPAWRTVLLKIGVMGLVPMVALGIPGVLSAGGQIGVPGVLIGSILIYVPIVAIAVQVARARWRDRP
jgi:hypothetical protein